MKKIVSLLVLIAIALPAIGQTETFDIATYNPPKGWKKDVKEGVVIYTDVNKSAGSFCILAIYASTPSSGEADKDFKNKWTDLAVTPYKADPNPKTETQFTAEGWKVVAGAAVVKQEGIDMYLILTVLSGFGKTVSIMANLNGQSYLTQVDALLESLKLDKTATVATPASNQNAAGKFGTMMYTLPAGWKEQKYDNGVLLTPKDLPAKEQLNIELMQSIPFSGTMEQALEKSYDDACAILKVTKMRDVDGGNYTALSPKKSFRGWEYIRCSGGIQVDNGTPYKDEYGLDLFVVRINNRLERVAVVKSRVNCNLSGYYPSDRLSYYNAIEKFLFSLQFTDWKEPVIQAGTFKGIGVVGVWEGISLSVGPATTSAPLGAQYKVFSPVFLSNGQAYFGSKFPSEGWDELNPFIRAENNRRDWGTYTFDNGRGVLKMPYGDIPLRMEGNKLIITSNKTDHAYHKLNFVDGATFNGTYALSELNGKIPAITFTSDGKFIDKGAIKVLYHEYVDCINEGLNAGSGTYEVRNYSVIFNYVDGRKIKIAFKGVDYDKNNKAPATLVLSSNDDMLKKQ